MNNSKWWLLLAMIIIGIGKALALKTPSQPVMLFAECHEKDVTIMFQAKSGSHIRNFVIQYNTTYDKDEWLDIDVEVPSNSTQVKVRLIPGVFQSFRVIAENEFGRSFPSEVSNPCEGKQEVPHKNPSNVTAVVDDSGKALKIPSQPWMLFAECHEKDVTVMFEPKYGSHIRNFLIQYNTSYNKDKWLDVDVEVPSNSTQVKLPLIPGVEQSFQVIAENEFGRSFPSEVSNPCKGKPEVPHKNPSNVTAVVDDSGNLVIRWIPLKRIYHNAPLLMYRVYFACNGERKHVYTVNDWRVGRMVYPGQSKLHNCEVVVTTLNSIGNSDADPEKVMSENVPYDATKKLGRNYVPDFTWELVKRYARNCTIVVKTIPSELDWKYTAFYLKYRKMFESGFNRTATESIKGNLTITGLENNALYDIALVVVSKYRNRYGKVQVISTYENPSYVSSGPILKKPVVTINTTITTSNSTENKKENVKSIDTQEAKSDAFWKIFFIVFTVISFSLFIIILTGIYYSRKWASFFLGFVDVESDGH